MGYELENIAIHAYVDSQPYVNMQAVSYLVSFLFKNARSNLHNVDLVTIIISNINEFSITCLTK